MRNHVRKYVLAVSLVAVLSTTVPAMAAARNGDSRDLFSRIRNVIIHVLDVVTDKLTFPPG
jgi:hypothetical protein